MKTIIDGLHSVLTVMGSVGTLVWLIALLFSLFLVIKGIFPVLYRLGRSLAKRKIAIFASKEFASLKCMLVDSRLFKGKNIIQAFENDLDKVKNETVFLVHWNDCKGFIDKILSIKKDSTALIVYAP